MNLSGGHPNNLSDNRFVEDTPGYDPDIYGGVQNDFGMLLNSTVFASSAVLLPFVPIIIIDTPLSFAVDTATLPYTIPYDLSQKTREEDPFEGKEYVLGVGGRARLKHKEGPSIVVTP